MKFVLLTAMIAGASLVYAKPAQNTKGLLPEVRMGNNESDNEKKALTSEIMITRSENQAIGSLQSIIKKSKGAANEADLWYRLAELYMRRSKSGRFFDLHQNSSLVKFSAFPIANEKGATAINRAIKIYDKIEQDFPKFKQMDSVLFNNAFANQQVSRINVSQALYRKLLSKFPNSPMIADGNLAIGELLYDQGKFEEALGHFLAVEKFPQARVYSYGMYKAAWTYYNMRDSERGIQKLVTVVQKNPPLQDGEVPGNRHNLRREALRDLTIFIGDSYQASDLYAFFKKVTTSDELGTAMIDLAKLYQSHSRHKDIHIFLEEYIAKNPTGSEVVRAHLFIVDANENLKKRDTVVKHLQQASNLCKTDSSWRSFQTAESVIVSCEEGFRRSSLDLAAKWWDIWQKNKKNVEFSGLTQRLFKLLLENENPQKPDLKTRFAYAELLFQLEKYDEASEQYLNVGTRSTDPTMKHDANYAALYSKEKSLGTQKNVLKEAERKDLATNYLNNHPKGTYARDIQFKLGHIAYEENNYDAAEKWLKPLTETAGVDAALKLKSEDLLLDIYNIRKDYASIQSFSRRIIASAKDDNNRKENMNKILEEAHFTEIQEFAKTGDKTQATEKLVQFAKEHKNSKLSKEATWQALSLLYSEGRIAEAADLSLEYTKKYPKDPRNQDALKDAANAYSTSGLLEKAADTLVLIADGETKEKNKYLELAGDYYQLENKNADARKAYNKILAQSDSATQSRLFGKLITISKNDSKEGVAVENKILEKGIEPYSTQIMIRRAQALFDQNKLSQAFDLALKANGRNADQSVRAGARVIQAKILEKELVAQSVKAKEDRLALVLGLKTEKLDKAHTAYLGALKMSQDPTEQIEALKGIDRCYENYIDSLKTIVLPDTLSDADKTALRDEFQKLVIPIQEKKDENEGKLKVLASTHGIGAATGYANLRPDQTVSPKVVYPEAEKFSPFFPASADFTIGKVSRIETDKVKSCARADIASGKALSGNFFEIAANCYSSRQFDQVEKLGLELAKTKKTRALGLYYASVASYAKGLNAKSLWLVEAALKEQSEVAPFYYQKAVSLHKEDGMTSAKPFFEKVLDMQMISTEMKTFAAIKAFSEGEYTKSVDVFSSLSAQQLYNLNVGILLSESYAQKGEVEKALKVVKDLLNFKRENADFLLQQAHLLETYKGSPTLALDSYEKALKSSQQVDLNDWLKKKIKYLQNQNKVGQHVISGDL